jgi:hypothetical protein
MKCVLVLLGPQLHALRLGVAQQTRELQHSYQSASVTEKKCSACGLPFSLL